MLPLFGNNSNNNGGSIGAANNNNKQGAVQIGNQGAVIGSAGVIGSGVLGSAGPTNAMGTMDYNNINGMSQQQQIVGDSGFLNNGGVNNDFFKMSSGGFTMNNYNNEYSHVNGMTTTTPSFGNNYNISNYGPYANTSATGQLNWSAVTPMRFGQPTPMSNGLFLGTSAFGCTTQGILTTPFETFASRQTSGRTFR